jgi:hypothetical protein
MMGDITTTTELGSPTSLTCSNPCWPSSCAKDLKAELTPFKEDKSVPVATKNKVLAGIAGLTSGRTPERWVVLSMLARTSSPRCQSGPLRSLKTVCCLG